MKRCIKVPVVTTLFAVLVGCDTPQLAPPHHVLGSTQDRTVLDCSRSKDHLCDHARQNDEQVQWYKDNEWRYNRGREADPDKNRPLVCVAVSGGGIRSAAFGIGVLKGLHEKSVTGSNKSLFGHVDMLSGTSGGSFAVTWYYMQTLKAITETNSQQVPKGSLRNVVPKEERVFEPIERTTKLQNDWHTVPVQLQDHGEFLGIRDSLLSGLGNVVMGAPLNWVFNGLWGMHLNANLAHYIYKRAIKRTFYSGTSKEIFELEEDIRKHRLPYFIITTTSRVDENKFHTEALLSNTVFEFTPLRIGNDGYRYIRKDNPVFAKSWKDPYQFPSDLAEIVAIAGAAPDSSQAVSGSTKRFLSSVLNYDYGMYVRNYNDARHWLLRNVGSLIPFPFYLFSEQYTRDLYGSDIYLSDGGHQENLAAYPLIRRQCEHIIVVDGEYDWNNEFEGYFKLKQAVEREMRVSMTLDKTAFCYKSSRKNCQETDIEKIQEILDHNLGFHDTRRDAELRRPGITAPFFSGQHPIVSGSIRHFPFIKDGKVEWNETAVTYIKLSIDESLFENWSAMGMDQRNKVKHLVGSQAAEYYGKVKTNTCETQYFYPCNFPQFSTIYQSFTEAQVEAYIDLGAAMVAKHLHAEYTKDRRLKLQPVDPCSKEYLAECPP